MEIMTALRSNDSGDALNNAIEEALKTHSSKIAVAEQSTTKPYWLRIIFAFLVLLLLAFGVIYTASSSDFADIHAVLLHSFELLSGGFIGMLIGEKASQ